METDKRREAALHVIRAARYAGDALFVELTGESSQVSAALLDEARASFESAARCAIDGATEDGGGYRAVAYPLAEIFSVAANAAFILVGDPEGGSGDDYGKEACRAAAIALRLAAGGCKELAEASRNGE